MSEGLIIALLSLLGTLAGTFSGILVANRLVNYRLEELEKKVDAHNRVAERVSMAEKRLDRVDEQFKSTARRLTMLERYEI